MPISNGTNGWPKSYWKPPQPKQTTTRVVMVDRAPGSSPPTSPRVTRSRPVSPDRIIDIDDDPEEITTYTEVRRVLPPVQPPTPPMETETVYVKRSPPTTRRVVYEVTPPPPPSPPPTTRTVRKIIYETPPPPPQQTVVYEAPPPVTTTKRIVYENTPPPVVNTTTTTRTLYEGTGPPQPTVARQVVVTPPRVNNTVTEIINVQGPPPPAVDYNTNTTIVRNVGYEPGYNKVMSYNDVGYNAGYETNTITKTNVINETYGAETYNVIDQYYVNQPQQYAVYGNQYATASSSGGCFSGGSCMNLCTTRCCAALCGILCCLGLLGLLAGLLGGLIPSLTAQTSASATAAANIANAASINSYYPGGAYYNGVYYYLITNAPDVYFFALGQSVPCNPYNNDSSIAGPTTSIVEVEPTVDPPEFFVVTEPAFTTLIDCNKVTTSYVLAYNISVSTTTQDPFLLNGVGIAGGGGYVVAASAISYVMSKSAVTSFAVVMATLAVVAKRLI